MATIDTTRPAGRTLRRLVDRLAKTRSEHQALEDYYTGEALCRPLSSKAQQKAYLRLVQLARLNYAELIVEAPRRRLRVDGFRTGADGDDEGDRAAWRIWQANQLDADSKQIFRMALTMRDAYVIVGQVDPTLGVPVISIEDPRYMVAEYDPARRRRMTAALKMVRDADRDLDLAYLYLADSTRAWVLRAARRTVDGNPLVSMDALEWVDETPIPFGVIPAVGFHTSPLGGRSWGEFERHIGTLDRINHGILARLEIATIQAFRQRAAEGGPTRDPQTGEEIDYANVFEASPGAIWHLPEGMKLWESGQVDLGPVREAVRDDVKDLAAVTSTPLYSMMPEAVTGSAEGASLAREGLVYKVEDHQDDYGESLEQMIALAFLQMGDTTRAARPDMEIRWRPAERFSLAERYDAASKAKDVLPLDTIRADVLQFSPQDVDRMRAEDEAAALAAPEPPAPIVVGAPVNA